MKRLIEDIEKKLKPFAEQANVTSNLDGGEGQVKTPYAFQRKPKSKQDIADENELINVDSFSKAEESNKNFESFDLFFKKIEDKVRHINEISYRDYKNAISSTQKQKINDSISNINKSLSEIDRMVNHVSKLKSEINDNNIFYSQSKSKLQKISNRLQTLTHKVRELNNE
jgi:methyl-accepting chemotaxis protein